MVKLAYMIASWSKKTISGLRNFRFRFSSGEKGVQKKFFEKILMHQKIRRRISGGVLQRVFEFGGGLVPEKCVLEHSWQSTATSYRRC